MAAPRKPLIRDNGKRGRRTAAQLERQEQVYAKHVIGDLSVRAIARELQIDRHTVLRDLAYEGERRCAELESRREFALIDSIAVYQETIRCSWLRFNLVQEMLLAASDGKAVAKIADASLRDIIDARTRIDKLLGLDAPIKIDVGLSVLLDALAPTADEPLPLPSASATVIEQVVE